MIRNTKWKAEYKVSKELATRKNMASLERVLIHGDLTPLNEDQRLQYVKAVCKALGISILFRPFDYIKMQGKTVLYANRACTEQLRKLHKISIKIIAREKVDGLYLVTAQATAPGKHDESIGAVNIKGLGGEALANAMMKAETKAKRRVTLSICGLGMLDEVEAKEVAEREAKMNAELSVEESEAILAKSESRPEFEKEAHAPSVEQEPPPPTSQKTHAKEYKLKSVRGAIGLPLSQAPLKKLMAWLDYFDKMATSGEPLHAEVQDDAFHIRAFIQDITFSKPELSEEAPNDVQ